jgi:VanZ family protein
MRNLDLPHRQACAEWSNRILILSLLGIVYLTFFPFRFNFAPAHAFHYYPILLGMTGKRPTHIDYFLNVLVFVPLGFGLSAKLRKRGSGRWTSLLGALVVGAVVSYVVEFVQFYIPGRDSGWDDVIFNTVGSVVGFFLFALCGGVLLEELSNWEDSFAYWLSPRRAALLLAAYFAIWFGVSVFLQNKTRLSDWDPQYILFVGNDASGQNPWKGQILLLQFWNRALPEQAIQRLAGRGSVEDSSAGLLGSYDFTGSPPYRDQRNYLPPLSRSSEQPQFTSAHASELDARSWLRTQSPVENLARDTNKTSQFTVHVVCAPATTRNAIGRIVSQSQTADLANFQLWQEGANLVFWFRSPMTETRAALAWTVRDVFEAGKVRDIVASYDGSDAYIYVDGHRVPRTYRLSPGAGFMQYFFPIKTSELQAYTMVYQTVVFLPAGLLLALTIRKSSGEKIQEVWLVVLSGVIPALLLEVLLSVMSGRRIWAGNIALSLIFGMAGILLMNADRGFKPSPNAP